MKKTILYSAISIALYGASIANAQEVIPVNENEVQQSQNVDSEPVVNSTFKSSNNSDSTSSSSGNTNKQNNPYINYSNSYKSDNKDSVTSDFNNEESSMNNQFSSNINSNSNTLNELMMTSGNQLSKEGIQEISKAQEQQAILKSRIETETLRKQLAELQKQISDAGGSSTSGGGSVYSLPELVGSQGVNGKLKATIAYQNTMFNIEKGDILDGKWVVLSVKPSSVDIFNVDSKDQATLQFNGPTIYKEYESNESKEVATGKEGNENSANAKNNINLKLKDISN